MRTQRTRIRTGRWRVRAIRALIVLLVAVVMAAAGAGVMWYAAGLSEYAPPPFEINARQGVPEPPKNMAYSPVAAEGGYAFSLAGNLYRQENGDLAIYLTNPEDSSVWLMCEVESVDQGVVYKSGVLKQGEYVERLTPLIDFPNEATRIEVRIYGFDPENWASKGTVYLNTTLQPW